MRGLKRNPWLFGLGLLIIPVLFGGQVQADINTDQAGSLVVFPKVVSDGVRDTVIKITNRSNMPAYAHCVYTNALGTCSTTTSSTCLDDGDCPTGETCDPQWSANNFDIFLTAQQPTFWRVSTGRFGDLTVPACSLNSSCSCTVDGTSGALVCPGFDAAASGGVNSIAIAGRGTDFVGELRCYQTMDDLTTPVGQNSLVGEAILETLSSGDISTYDAIHIAATDVNGDNDLLLDGSEYAACPDELLFASHGAGATADIAGVTGIEFNTELTLVPCTALWDTATPVTATVSVFAYDELELALSADGIPVTCFSNNSLADTDVFQTIYDASQGDRNYLKTRILVDDTNICLTGTNAGSTCTDDNDCPGAATTDAGVSLGCQPSPGVLGVVEEFYSVSGSEDSHAAWSLTMSGARSSDVIAVPDPSGNP